MACLRQLGLYKALVSTSSLGLTQFSGIFDTVSEGIWDIYQEEFNLSEAGLNSANTEPLVPIWEMEVTWGTEQGWNTLIKKWVKWHCTPQTDAPRQRAPAPCPPSLATTLSSSAILVAQEPSNVTQPGYDHQEQCVAVEKDLDLQLIWFDLGTFSNCQATWYLGLGQTLKRDRPFA